MAKFMYWLWGVAEEREFNSFLLRPLWSWLTRLCDRYHGYRHDAEGFIIQDHSTGQGPTQGGY